MVAAAACSCTFAKSSERLIAPARASHADPARSLVSRSRAEGPSGRVTGMINGTRVCVVARRGRHQFKPLGARSRRRHFDETDGMATSGAMDAPAPSVSGKARYIKGATLGEGTFGVVTKAEDTLTRKHVAIKKIRMGKFREGINFTAIREIKLLQELRHPHVIELVDCFPHKRNLNLVFECCESDLEAVIKDKFLPLGTPEIKSYMQMTLKAVAYCHASWVLHRDLKPNNLLIAPNGALKLADFGLARVFGSPNRKFTHQVFARWYRAPELLLGSKAYGPGVDIWAVGCIFAELMLRKPFFPGSSDIDQLGRIYAGLGTPTEESWPGHANLPDWMEFQFAPAPPLRQLFATAPPDALDLLSKLLAFDPNRRISAEQALRHPYFDAQPLATPFPDLPRPTRRFGDEGGGGGGGDDERDLMPPPGDRRGGGSPGSARGADRRSSGAMDTGGEAAKRAKTEPRAGEQRRRSHSDSSPGSAPANAHRRDRRGDSHGGGPGRMSTGGGPVGFSGLGLGSSGAGASGVGAEGCDRPALSTVDRAYLRKRKLDLDNAFLAASQEIDDAEAMVN